MEDNNTQLYRSPVTGGNNSNSAIKMILFIIIGAIIGAGISIPLFLLTKKKAGTNQKTETKIVEKFKKDLKKSFSITFENSTNADIYFSEARDGDVKISAIMDLPPNEIKKIFGVDLRDGLSQEDSGVLKDLAVIIQMEYLNKDGKWVLKGKPKAYEGIELNFFMKSMNEARHKAKDIAIKADLGSLRSSAELWAMDHDDSYSGFCESSDVHEAMEDIRKNGAKAYCADADDEWAVFAPLYDKEGKCLCVDYEGTVEELDGSCPAEAVTVCP